MANKTELKEGLAKVREACKKDSIDALRTVKEIVTVAVSGMDAMLQCDEKDEKLDATYETVRSLTGQLEVANGKLADSETAGAAGVAEIQEVKASLETLKESNAELEATVAEYKATIDSSSDKPSNWEAEWTALQAEISVGREKLVEMRQETDGVRGEHAGVKESEEELGTSL